MAVPRSHEVDADYSSRTSHQVASPERYESWRDYAFSEAPELASDALSDDTPAAGIRTV